MANTNFRVKHGLVVNDAITINSTAIYFSGTQTLNSTAFVGISNNTSFVGSVSAANVVSNAQLSANLANFINTTSSGTFAGNITFSSTDTTFSDSLKVGANVVINTSAILAGNSTQNAVVNSTGLYVNGQLFESSAGGGYYKGNLGPKGNTNNKGNLYRINSNTQNANVTIEAGENALTVGPMTIADGYNLTIDTGGRGVII